MKNLLSCYFLILWTVAVHNGQASPSLLPMRHDDYPFSCFKDWNQLKAHVEQGKVARVVSLCPNTTFYLDEKQNDHWINIDSSTLSTRNQQQLPLVIQCGSHGHLQDDCVVDGGMHHFWMERGAQNIVLKGLTFQNAKYGSIWHACCNVQVQYENCTWRDNHHVQLPTSNTQTDGGGAAISGYNADLSFLNCTFLRNSGPWGAISVGHSDVRFDQCQFGSNRAGEVYSAWRNPGSVLSTGDRTKIWMKDSCVLENVAPGQSSIGVCPNCHFQQNTNNFAAANNVGSSTSAYDLTCEHAINFNSMWDPFCVRFDGVGEDCGLDPEPLCMPSTGPDDIETCFQFETAWEDCDPTREDCPCDAFVRSPYDDSPLCNQCERCPDGTLSFDCSNVEHGFLRRLYRDCDQSEEVCEPGTHGYLKCVEFNGECTGEGCACRYSVRDEDSNKFGCSSCTFCADGSVAYDCTAFRQGFHFCDTPAQRAQLASRSLSLSLSSPSSPPPPPSSSPSPPPPPSIDLSSTVCLPDSDDDGVKNCFQFENGWRECDPSMEDCPCDAFVRSTTNGDSESCHSCTRCPDNTLAWDCVNLEHAHFRRPFRSCGSDTESCEADKKDGSLHCTSYNQDCTQGKDCPCMYSIRNANLGRRSCGECSFCSDGSVAYDCTNQGYGSRTCDDNAVVAKNVKTVLG